jgi:hypothetical protein
MSSRSAAQTFSQLQAPSTPLVLEQQGSFYVGGRTATVGDTGFEGYPKEFGGTFQHGRATVDQMYVQFQRPATATHIPIIFIHGCCLTSKTWETTPDGRMGWYEYFTRRGFPTFLAEQAGRARSGFNGAAFNAVRNGSKPASEQPRMLLPTEEFTWMTFRFGPSPGKSWPDEQFPVGYVNEFYKQLVPDLSENFGRSLLTELADPAAINPTIDNLAALAEDLHGAILVGHSQAAGFPTKAVLRGKKGIRGMVQLEMGCFSNLTDEQVRTLAQVPMLFVAGDHFNQPQPAPDCNAEMARVKAAGGDVTFISLPDLGMHGNSHMFMQDRNNLQIADIIIKWVQTHVSAAPRGK